MRSGRLAGARSASSRVPDHVSTATAPTPHAAQPTFRPGLIARAIAFFSGSVGFAIKIALLSASNALAVWALYVLAHAPSLAGGRRARRRRRSLIDWVYLVPRSWTLPAKFLIPGTVFLVGFQIIPILFTINVAFSNYSTGHILTQGQAIAAIKINSLEPPRERPPVRHGACARLVAASSFCCMHDETGGKVYVGTTKGLTELPKGDVTHRRDRPADRGEGLHADHGRGALRARPAAARLQGADDRRRGDPAAGHGDRRRARADAALRLEAQRLRADHRRQGVPRQRPRLVRRTAAEELEPGWKTYIGFRNFSRIIHDPLVRKPFLSIFAWTFVFAASTVFFSFAVGLFLAIALDKRGMRFQKLYRSVLVIPYAIPGFLSLLVWAGLLNDDFGVVNRVFGIHVPWLFGSNVFSWLPFISWPRIAVVLVSVWLTTPYFFLVSMGALQSIPERAHRGGARRRRRRLADLPPRDAAAAARRRRAADDRVVRVQLQQLQQRLPADRRRPVQQHVVDRGQHGHPDQLHVQARDRVGEGIRLRPGQRRRDHHLLHRRRRSRACPSGARSHWRTCDEPTLEEVGHEQQRVAPTAAAAPSRRRRSSDRRRG